MNKKHWSHLLLIFIAPASLLFANLFTGGLSGYDDAFYAHEARQMVETGDWWNVRYNGYLNFEYPPLFIWLEAASFFVLGFTDFAAKLPTALLGLLTFVLVFLLAKELSDEFLLPVVSAWILLSTLYFMKWTMRAMTDVPFVFFFTLAIFFYVKGLKRSEFFIFCGLAVGLGIMTRSVIGLIPLTVIFSHLVLTKQFKVFSLSHFQIGITLAFVIPAGWFIPQYLSHGDKFIIKHFSFIMSKVAPGESFDLLVFLRNLFEYPWLLVKRYEPWVWLVLAGLAIHFRRAYREKDSTSILLCLWVFLVIVPFSFAEIKILRYILPAFPAFSIIAATPLSYWLKNIKRKKIISAVNTILFLAIILVVYPNTHHLEEEMKIISRAVQVNVAEDERVIFYTGKEQKYDFHNQLLWYSNRFSEFLDNEKTLKKRLYSNSSLTFVLDKKNFQLFSAHSDLRLQILTETNNFVCFKTHSFN